MKRTAAAIAAAILLCGSVGASSAAEGGVSLEGKGFDIAQNYSLPDDAQIVSLAEMGLEIYDIVPDLSGFYDSENETIEYIGADDGYVFFDIRNSFAGTTEIVRVDCITGEASQYRFLYNSSVKVNYIDNEYILYTSWNGYDDKPYSCLYSAAGDVVRLEYCIQNNAVGARVGNTFYYNGIVYADRIDGRLEVSVDGYLSKYSMPVIFQYNAKTGENGVFKFNAKDPQYGAGELSYTHYLSADNLYNSKSNYVDYQEYSDGAYEGYTYRIKDEHLFGDRYALGYCHYSGVVKMAELAVSNNGAKPTDLHITKNAIAAWTTTTVLDDDACPILMNIYSKQIAALDGMPCTCTMDCDNTWLYFVKDYIALYDDGRAETTFRIVSVR